ncbi:LolA family protein [Chryseobacterium hagamense]|uniref:Membrane protein n=1 Tax=Chryseobacterium hagamense TaxID=395935 RepID=A0A511YGZ3_9FLAO|nr:outer membrane lipoprotein carrier protein LolA [Chryseobacterium hagamense]GEN74470.1 membrane protein [Chryseobacterium hagamense]
MKHIISKIVVGSMVVGAVGFTNAQKIDAKAKKILDDITANYKSKKNTYFKFSFGSGTNGKVDKSEPGIYYAAGDKYKLKIMETEQIFDGSKIYNINTEDKEVTVAKPNGSSSMFSPINYLSSYRNDYNVTYEGKKNVNGVNADFIKLTPVKSNGIQAVYLFVNAAKKQMIKLEQHGNNNDLAVIAITQYKENQTLDPGMFVFDKNKYKNYLVTEL